ncbi:hypothetical protein HZS_1443 [Henneguya salminicola]|nr:hypothetical protein HZS_1443 [Henneguya salminicola]
MTKKLIEIDTNSPENNVKLKEFIEDIHKGYAKICWKLLNDLKAVHEYNPIVTEEKQKIHKGYVQKQKESSSDSPTKAISHCSSYLWNNRSISKSCNILQQKNNLSKEKYITELENYIDAILILIIENNPSLLEKYFIFPFPIKTSPNSA